MKTYKEAIKMACDDFEHNVKLMGEKRAIDRFFAIKDTIAYVYTDSYDYARVANDCHVRFCRMHGSLAGSFSSVYQEDCDD